MRAAAALLAAVAVSVPAVSAAARPAPPSALAGIDALIETALAGQKIPGAAVGIVAGGEVVLLKGYGVRDIERKLPMTPDTLMPIASVTKQFTLAALGTLVRRGKLAWDTPVRDYLPEFRLHDDYATLRATPRDLVTRRIGLPRHEIDGIDWQVLLREDGVLQYVVLGRPRDLVPVRGTLFRVKDLTGFSLEFLKGADGKVDRLAVHADGSTIGPRRSVSPPR